MPYFLTSIGFPLRAAPEADIICAVSTHAELGGGAGAAAVPLAEARVRMSELRERARPAGAGVPVTGNSLHQALPGMVNTPVVVPKPLIVDLDYV